jgi:hypothetical protein
MSFTLQIRFAGLLHYIPNSSQSEKKVRLCVVMPEAENHRSGIAAIGRGTMSLGGQPIGRSAVSLDNKRAVFRFERENGQTGPLDYEGPMLGKAVKGVVPFVDIAGNRADRNPRVVSAAATNADGVHSQVLLTEGVFSLQPSNNPPAVELPGDLTGAAQVIRLAETVFMTVEGLDSAQVVVSSLEGEDEEIFTIEPNAQGIADLLVAHLCPSAADHARRANAVAPLVDVDFKFHYRLLTPPPEISLVPPPQPVPTFRSLPQGDAIDDFGLFNALAPAAMVGEGPPNSIPAGSLMPFILTPTGCNCAGTGALARPFDLDQFVSTALPGAFGDRATLRPAASNPPA